jgi:hypothetical protein
MGDFLADSRVFVHPENHEVVEGKSAQEESKER